MSRKRKNNHYHYAEKFADRARREKSAALHMPRRAVFFTVLMLLVFGLICTTFSVDNTVSATESASDGSVMVSVRNAKVKRDIALTGASADADLVDTGADVDLIPTAAQTYYYSGQGNGTNWTKTAMAVSTDGFYEYYQITSTTTHQFKIGTSSNQYAYNHSYVDASFNGTNVSQIGDYGGDNCYCWKGSTHYIIVYYPNTIINTTNNPKICASTTLPDNSLQVSLGEFFTNSSTTTEHLMTNSSGTWSYTKSLTGGLTRDFYFHINYKNHSGDESYYKDQNEATMTYDHCTDWQFETNGNGNPKLQTVITGNYTFRFVLSSKKVSVVYPKYNVTATINTAGAASAPTVGTASVSIGSSSTLTAAAANTGYEFVRWEVTSGTVKTGSYDSGTAITTSENTSLTVYPYGTEATVTLQAVYKVKEYDIIYNDGSGNPVTSTIGGTVTKGTKQYNQPYTIKSSSEVYTRGGYTQVGWSTSRNYTSTDPNDPNFYGFGTTYNYNGNLTLYPVWQLNAPTAELHSGTMTAGDTNGINLLESVAGISDAPSDANITDLTFTISTTVEDSDAAVTASNGTAATRTNAYFFTTIPGTYTVDVSVTFQNSTGVTNANSEATYATNQTTRATITVLPVAPSFNFNIYGIANPNPASPSDSNYVVDLGSSNHPYLILVGSEFDFEGVLTSPHPINGVEVNGVNKNGYTYEWSLNNFATTLGSGSSIRFNANTPPDVQASNPNYRPSVAQDGDHSNHTLTLTCRASCNGQSSTNQVSLTYLIQPLVENFGFEPSQKIYNINDSKVSIAADYLFDNPSGFTTQMQFSHDNDTFTYNAVDDQVQNQFMTSFFNTIKRYLYPAGPKYFFMHIYKQLSDRTIVSDSPVIHSTVDTKDSEASKPLYFYNKTTTELSGYQVMCYWINSGGTYGYQIAQDLYQGDADHDGFTYRVNIPASATHVQFALFRKSEDKEYHYYGTPTFSNNTFTFSAPHYAGYTNLVALTSATRVIETGAAATTETQTVDSESYSMYIFTCTASEYKATTSN